jgi:hypothetical protein
VNVDKLRQVAILCNSHVWSVTYCINNLGYVRLGYISLG